jgi:hypothetical protein
LIQGEGQLIFKNGSIKGKFKNLQLLEGDIKIFFNDFTENLEGKVFNLDVSNLKKIKSLTHLLMAVG